MSGRTKQHPTKKNNYHVIVEGPGKNQFSSWISKETFEKVRALLTRPSEADSTPWKELAADRIAKHSKAGLALRGARTREGISQKKLAELSGVSQENISRMENGKRPVGQEVAKRLSVALGINIRLLKE